MSKINNEVYHTLGDRWYEAQDDPIALLRAEHTLRFSWMQTRLKHNFGPEIPWESLRFLDLGCGAGFLSNDIAELGASVQGIDISEESIETAKRYDKTGKVEYFHSDIFKADLPEKSFDVVCAMDFLEHVESPERVFQMASQCLKPGGIFFFHTFNRTWLSWLFAIKGLEIFVKNTPKNLHVYNLFIKPDEVVDFCQKNGMQQPYFEGVMPKVFSANFLKLLFTGVVPKGFTFQTTSSLGAGYFGEAYKGLSGA